MKSLIIVLVVAGVLASGLILLAAEPPATKCGGACMGDAKAGCCLMMMLACKDQLQLSDEQVQKLQAICAKAQQDAAAVLTDAQKAKMQECRKAGCPVKGAKAPAPAAEGKGCSSAGGCCGK